MNYYISDLHLFHKNVTKSGGNFDGRPFENLEEMHSLVKERWNAKVTNGDAVYILGDMAMRGKQEDLIAYVSTLKGRKTLVKGNHDDVSDYRYQRLFNEICDYKELKETLRGKSVKLILCHYPILMWNEQRRGSILLYGHVHRSIEDRHFKKCLQEMNNEEFFGEVAGDSVLKAYNVGCMLPYMNYEPRTLSEIVEGYEALRRGTQE